MEFNNISALNTYELIKSYLSRDNITPHITKHLSTATLKPVDDIFSSIINDSFIILKFQENQNRSNFIKYIPSSNDISNSDYDRIEISSSIKSIIGIEYNNNSLFFILNIGSTFTIVTPNNIINYESLTLKESKKLGNEIGKKYIIKIACGENHCLFLTHAGMIYTMGDNTYGQLGIGQNNITKESKEGLMVKELLNYRINEIAAGKNHSFCFGVVREMTKAGASGPNNNMEFDPKQSYFLFGWGDNSFFQIGMKQANRNKIILKPTKIYCSNNFHNPAIIGEELINICCGFNFSALLFKNGKLLTFGDNQYNQVIYKENEIFPNNVSNNLPKNIGKIVKIITSGNSLLLISEFNKIIIFGKFNENKDEIKIIDLIDNYENNKYIFNDKLLKIVFFNNEDLDKKIFGDIKSIKIEEFLVNTKAQKNEEKNIKEKEIYNTSINSNTNYNKMNSVNISNRNNINLKISNNNNSPIRTSNKTLNNINNISLPNNEINNKKNINDKTVYETNINNRILESSPKTNKQTKIKNDLNNNAIPNSSSSNKKYADFKNISKKFQNMPKQHKYKNSYTIQSSNNDTLKKFGVIQAKNTKVKIEPKKEYNGAEDKNKTIKTMENNNNINQNQKIIEYDLVEEKANYKINTSPSKNTNKDNNIINELSNNNLNKDNNIINGNKNENGNSEQNNIIMNKIEIENKDFLNKNILKNKTQKTQVKNRYDDDYYSSFINQNKTKEKNKEIPNQNQNQNQNKDYIINIENKQNEIKNINNGEEENNKKNGGFLKNGQNEEKPIEINNLKDNNNSNLETPKTNYSQNNNIIESNPNIIKEKESLKNEKGEIINNKMIQDNEESQNKNSSTHSPALKINDNQNKIIFKKESGNIVNENKNIKPNINNPNIDNNKNNLINKNNNNFEPYSNTKINKDNNISSNFNKKEIDNNNNIDNKNSDINNNLINNNNLKNNNNLNNNKIYNVNVNNNTLKNNNKNNLDTNKIFNINNKNNTNTNTFNNNNNINNLNNKNNNIKNNKPSNKLPIVNNQLKNKEKNNSKSKNIISISKKAEEDEDYDIFQSINKNKSISTNINNNIPNNKKNNSIGLNNNNKNKPNIPNYKNLNINNNKTNINISKSPKKITSQDLSPKSNEKEKENKESINLFRELSQFVSTTVNKINKYSQNRTDAKKDAFFEEIVSNNNNSINFRNINPKLLIKNVISGVPNRYRGRFWLKCIGNQLSITPDYFDINLSKYYEKNEDTKYLKYKLPFPYLGIFKEDTPLTSDLVEVINGFIIARPDIEYNEKISYLVGMLIINMDKYQAYVSFMNLILNPNLIIYYLSTDKEENIMEYGYTDTPGRDDDNNDNYKPKKIPSIVEINLRRVIFKQLLFHNLPDLCSHLELLNILPEDYFDEWNETIFCKNFNIDIAMKIWDLFVIQGQKIVFDAGIALMKELQDDLLDCEEKEEVLDILLNSQMREINEINVLNEIQKVEYPEWIQSEVQNMAEDTIIPISFNKN